MAQQPHVLVFGVGSIGAVYLYQLQRAGCKTTAVCRSNFDTATSKGFTLNSLRYGTQHYRPDHVVRSVSECPRDTNFDYVLVSSKSFPGQKPSLADTLRPAIENRPDTAIVLAQNGIDIEQEIHEVYPDNPLISGVVYLPATQTSPGVIEYTEMLNLLELGTYPASAPPAHKAATQRFADLMNRGGGGAKVFDNIQEERWSKLVMNAAWNPITALTLCTDGGFLKTSDPFARELVWGLMMEVVALAQEVGIPGVDEKAAEEKLAIATRRAESGTGREMSMLQDVKLGRPFEVEAIVGNTVRLGRKHGVAMPRLDTMYALAKARHIALERGEEGVR